MTSPSHPCISGFAIGQFKAAGSGNAPASIPSTEFKGIHKTCMHALIIEDIQCANTALCARNYTCDRITHNELMAVSGEHFGARLHSGIYHLLWICTPCDWYVRTPGKRGNPHWQRLISFVRYACLHKMHVIVYGPQVFYGNFQISRKRWKNLN